MTTFAGVLHKDIELTKTSFREANIGDGTTDWFAYVRAADGGLVQIGLKADAAVTDPTVAANVIALLKGILTTTRLSPAGLLKAEDAVAVSGDSGVLALAVRRDTAIGSAADGDYIGLSTDSLGRLRVLSSDPTITDPTNATTTALAASLVVKAAAGKLWGITGYSTAAQFVQVHNASSLPADASAPVVVFPVEANKPFSIDFGAKARAFSTGIVVCDSSTGPTKTIGGATCWFDAQYE